MNKRLVGFVLGLAVCLPVVAGGEQISGKGNVVVTKAPNSAAPGQVSQPAVWTVPGKAVGPDIELVDGKRAVRGEILVAFRPEVDPGRADAVRNGLGATEVDELGQIGVRVWRLPPGLAVADALGVLKRDPSVRFAEPNLIMSILDEIFEGPGDPSFVNPQGWPFGYQEHLRQDYAATREIHVEGAWADGAFGAGVVVAVVDTGVDLDHPDLDGNLFRDGAGKVIGGNFVSTRSVGANDGEQHGLGTDGKPGKPPSTGGSPQDDNGHGTHVAGIIAAEMNNIDDALKETTEATDAWSGGVVGVAPQAKIMPVKVLDASGTGGVSGVAKGILFAADNGAHIVNLSIGGGFSQTVSDAIKYAWVTKDVLVIAAAGNSGSETPSYPGSDLYAVSVAAVDAADKCASFSNLGWSVDVAAPGVEVLSSLIDGTGAYTGGYGRMSGTSMACPVAVGVSALIRGKNPQWHAEQVAAQLLATTENVDADNPGLEGKLGTGRVNAQGAVGTEAIPKVAVQGLGCNGGMITALGPSDSIWVKFSHAVDKNTALDIGSYQLMNTDNSTPVGLVMASTDYQSFPGQAVRLRIQEELPLGNYQFVVSSGLAGGHVHSFAIAPTTIAALQEVLPMGSLVYKGTAKSQFRPVNALGLSQESEPNDTLGDADSLPGWYPVAENCYRTVLTGSIDPLTDADYYAFPAAANDVITVTMTCLDDATGLDCYLELRDTSDTILAYNDDRGDGTMNSRIANFVVPASGTYYIRAISWQNGSSGPHKLVADLTTASPPPQGTDLPDAVARTFSMEIDPAQTVTTRLHVGEQAEIQLYHNSIEVTPAEDREPGPGVLYQSVGPLSAGCFLIKVTPQDPFSTGEFSLDVVLNAGLEEDEDSATQTISLQPLEASSGMYRGAVAGRLLNLATPRIYAETPGTDNDLRGSWDRIAWGEWAINAEGNPEVPVILNRGVKGTLTATKRTVERDRWYIDATEGDLLSLRVWGKDSGGGTANNLRANVEITGPGWGVWYYGHSVSGYPSDYEITNLRVPQTGRCTINVGCVDAKSIGTYTLTVELISETDPRIDIADSYMFTLESGGSVQTYDIGADPRVDVAVQQGDGNFLVTVTPKVIGPIEYSVVLTVNAAFDKALGNETPATAQSLEFGPLGHVGGGVAGYFSDLNETTLAPEGIIRWAGMTPVRIADIATFDFSAIQVLMLHTLNEPPSAALVARLSDIESWVRSGGILVVHDRRVSSTENVAEPNPVLVGAPSTLLERNFDYAKDIDVISTDTLVTSGPGGNVDNTTLDNGNYSNHGFADPTTLPPGTVSILSAGPGVDRVAAFAYPLGEGFVYYSTIPLDFYLEYYFVWGNPSPVTKRFVEVYARNVLAYVKSLGGADQEDWYTLGDVAENVTISIETHTPADGSGQFVNLLNPSLELWSDSSGTLTLVAVGTEGPDGANETITYTVPAGGAGTYYVRVAAENGTHGEYVLGPAAPAP